MVDKAINPNQTKLNPTFQIPVVESSQKVIDHMEIWQSKTVIISIVTVSVLLYGCTI